MVRKVEQVVRKLERCSADDAASYVETGMDTLGLYLEEEREQHRPLSFKQKRAIGLARRVFWSILLQNCRTNPLLDPNTVSKLIRPCLLRLPVVALDPTQRRSPTLVNEILSLRFLAPHLELLLQASRDPSSISPQDLTTIQTLVEHDNLIPLLRHLKPFADRLDLNITEPNTVDLKPSRLSDVIQLIVSETTSSAIVVDAATALAQAVAVVQHSDYVKDDWEEQLQGLAEALEQGRSSAVRADLRLFVHTILDARFTVEYNDPDTSISDKLAFLADLVSLSIDSPLRKSSLMSGFVMARIDALDAPTLSSEDNNVIQSLCMALLDQQLRWKRSHIARMCRLLGQLQKKGGFSAFNKKQHEARIQVERLEKRLAGIQTGCIVTVYATMLDAIRETRGIGGENRDAMVSHAIHLLGPLFHDSTDSFTQDMLAWLKTGTPPLHASEPPLRPVPATCTALDAAIQEDYDATKTRSTDRRMRDRIVSLIEHLSKCDVEVYGSCASGFDHRNSDIDVGLLHIDEAKTVRCLRRLERALRKARSCSSLVGVYHARVPVLKLVMSSSFNGIEVDICRFYPTSAVKSALLWAYASSSPVVQPLVAKAKAWSKQHKIGDAQFHTLSSFAVTLMMLHFLVQHKVIEPLEVDADEPLSVAADRWKRQRSTVEPPPLGQLFIGFLHYYGHSFRYWRHRVQLKAQRVDDGGDRRDLQQGQRTVMVVLDPVDPTDNVTRSVGELHAAIIASTFRQAYLEHT